MGLRKENPVERKLKDIEREKKRLRDEMKHLSRALRRGDAITMHTPDAPSAPLHSLPRSTGYVEPMSSSDKTVPVRGDERFASYFATGGFKSPMPGRQERAVQRNKAIFMLILVSIAGYIVFKLVTR
jgi:hypothetical protein